MSEIKNWVRDFTFQRLWNDDDKEIRWVLRIYVCGAVFGFTYLSFTYSMLALMGVPLPMYFFGVIGTILLSITLGSLTVLGVQARSYYGWLGLIVSASQSLAGPGIVVGIFLLYWFSRVEFRGKFGAPVEFSLLRNDPAAAIVSAGQSPSLKHVSP